MTEPAPILPPHIEETVHAMARLHAEHYERRGRLQTLLDSLTGQAARPRFVIGVALVLTAWIGFNLALVALGRRPVDAPPFPWMQGVISLGALGMTCLILTTQRREDELAGRRAQLNLQLTIQSERKTAKIIELLEELRRDSPTLANRHDSEAAAMAAQIDPRTVLDAIDEADETPSSEPPAS